MALVDHIVVLDHLQLQVVEAAPTQSWEDVLRRLDVPAAKIAELPAADRERRVGMEGAARVTHAALDMQALPGVLLPDGRPAQTVREVYWPCGCGIGLHPHKDLVVGSWATHVAEAEGVPAERLILHAVASIRAEADAAPVVSCLCGTRFAASGYLANDALDAWEAHVRRGA